MGGELTIGDRAWALSDPTELRVRGLWERMPRWSLSGTVRVEGASSSFALEGTVHPAVARACVPADLVGARWSGPDALERLHEHELVGAAFVAASGLPDWDPERGLEIVSADHDLRMSEERATVSIRGELVGETWDAPRRVAPFRLTTQAAIVGLAPFEGCAGSTWPPTESTAELQRFVRGFEAFHDATEPVAMAHYDTGREGASSATVWTIAADARAEALVHGGLRMLRSRADRMELRALSLDELDAAWSTWQRLLLAPGGAQRSRGAWWTLDPSEARARVDAIRSRMIDRPRAAPRGPELRLELHDSEGTQVLTGRAARRHPWPVQGPITHALAHADDWNQTLILVRTPSVDALVDWATGA